MMKQSPIMRLLAFLGPPPAVSRLQAPPGFQCAAKQGRIEVSEGIIRLCSDLKLQLHQVTDFKRERWMGLSATMWDGESEA